MVKLDLYDSILFNIITVQLRTKSRLRVSDEDDGDCGHLVDRMSSTNLYIFCIHLIYVPIY